MPVRGLPILDGLRIFFNLKFKPLILLLLAFLLVGYCPCVLAVTFWTDFFSKLQFTHEYSRPEVQAYIHKDGARLKILKVELERAKYLFPYVVEQLEKRHMPVDLALLPFIESGYNPTANSHAGAQGLWQLMPSTVKDYGYDAKNFWINPRTNVILSTDIALATLQHLHQEFNSWFLAFAAYNVGPGFVANVLEEAAKKGESTHYWQLALPQQTKNYIPKLLALSFILSHAKQFNLELPIIPAHSTPSVIQLPFQLDIYHITLLAKIDPQLFHLLNPGFNQIATPPEQAVKLLLPLQHGWLLSKNLANFHSTYSWHIYQVEAGQTLSQISKITNNSIEELIELNNIHNEKIYVGQKLVFRAPKHFHAYQHYIVKAGDTLSSIAKRFHVSVKKLLEWNQISRNAILHVGQSLIIRDSL